MKKKNIVFLDFHSTSGLGHLSRCKYLLKYLNLKSAIFISEKKINEKGFKCINITFDKFLKENKENFNIAIIDSYKITYEQEKKIKKISNKLITIDDENKRRFCCDYLINYNPEAKNFKYQKKIQKDTKLLLGKNYNFILNFKKIKIKTNNKINILIYFGTKNRSIFLKKKILDKLKKNKKIIGKIKIFSKYQFYHKDFNIEFKYNKNKKIILSDIKNSDICIISSGIIIYEALSYKKLIFAKPISNNQLSHYKYLLKNKLIHSTNNLKNFTFTRKKINEINPYKNDLDVYYDRSKILQLIINPLKDSSNKNLYLTYYDKKYDFDLYRMQTSSYRKFYINKNKFSYFNHKKYLSLMNQNKISLYIIKRDEKFAGYLKFEIKKRKIYVSIAILKKYQKKQIAYKVLQYLMKNSFFKLKPFAEINNNNFASLKTFKKAGFKTKNIKTFV